MQIQLKQFEIVQALRQYITKQGIDLADKVVNIEFTAGRKSSGLLADITIEDTTPTEFPVLDVGTQALVKPSLAIVVTPSPTTEDPPVMEAQAETTTATAATAAPKSPTVSLFG